MATGLLPHPDYRVGATCVWDIDVPGDSAYAAVAVAGDPRIRVTVPDTRGTLQRLAVDQESAATLACAVLGSQGASWVPRVFQRSRSRRAARDLLSTTRAVIGDAVSEPITAVVGAQPVEAVGWRSEASDPGMFTTVTVGGLTLIPTETSGTVVLNTPVAAEAAAAVLCAAFHA